MTLIKWDPFRDLLDFSIRPVWPAVETDDASGSWTPRVDVFEKGDNLVIRAEMPGVEKDDVDVRIEGNTVTLRGERKRDAELREETAYRRERIYGAFVRSFRLPKTVDAGGIAASYRDGVLEITLPKAEESKPKKIDVQAA